MINKLLNRIKSSPAVKENQESGAAMIFAVILLIMLVSVSLFVASAATSQANVSKTQSVRTALMTGSDNGIEWALSAINSNKPLNGVLPAINGMTATNPYVSTSAGAPVTINGVKQIVWKVWTEKVVTGNNELSYYIYSKAYSLELGESRSITQRAIVESTAITKTETTTGADGKISMTYRLDSIGALSQGIFTNNRMNVNGNSKVYAYNSLREGSYPTGTNKSTVATNGFVQIAAADMGIERIIGGLETASSGCFPANICSAAGAPAVSYRDANLGFQTIPFKNDYCPEDTYPNWQASANSGTLLDNKDGTSDGIMCVGSLILDTNTIVSGAYTTTKPLTIIVHGSVSVSNGAKVNWGFSPQRLKVIGVGGSLDIPRAGNPSVSMLYASEGANCTIGANNGAGTATYFGALACGNITLETGNKIFVDTATYAIANDPAAGTKIWFKVYQEELEDKS